MSEKWQSSQFVPLELSSTLNFRNWISSHFQSSIPKPEKKLRGTVAIGLTKFMIGMAQAQGKEVPSQAVPVEQKSFEQEILLVITRQDKANREGRTSVRLMQDTGDIGGASMAKESVSVMYRKLGLDQ